MDGRNGDCFEHDTLFGHIPTEANIDHSCLNDYLLEPSAHDKISCDGMYFPNTKSTFSPADSYGCNHSNMMNVPSNLHSTPYLGVHNAMGTTFLPGYGVPNCTVMPNTSMAPHFNNNNLACNEYTAVNNTVPYVPVNSIPESKPMIHQPIMHETSALVNRTQQELLSNFSKNVPESVISANADGLDLIGNNNSSFMASPLFSAETLPVSKVDSDPFSPSISSSVSSIPSVEMPDKSSYVPGSVDSGVVVNGCSSSPFSTSDSNRNGECSSINDSLISPLTQGPGSERSVETTPGSESVSSEMCSPRVDFEMLSLELNAKNHVRPKEKSHKGRKRKNEQKKEKATKTKKHPVIVPTYQSQISPGQNGIKIRISRATPGPIPVSRKRRKHKKQSDADDGPQEQTDWGARLPELVLRDIFRAVTESDGCFPSLLK